MGMRSRAIAGAVTLGALVACGGGGVDAAAVDDAPAPTVQEGQCQAAGWQRQVVRAAGLPRLVLWKAPPDGWPAGAIVVMHGGGGRHTNFCAANVELIAPQVRFTQAAVAAGYAVFLLDSSDLVTDNAGRLCGKVWDDEVRERPSVDLPFVEQVLRTLIPSLRPARSRGDVFVTGLSSGGYMSVRAATRHGDLVSAFAPVSAGDPYGWQRDCTPRPGDRSNVFGVALDNETGRPIHEAGACAATATPNERPWDGAAIVPKPPFRVFHHAQDGIHDRSCVEKLRRQLADRGYAETAPFVLDGGPRRTEAHYWLDEYNEPLLAFFAAQRRAGASP
jgi:poly(3-hydroxybutyrate) depolymerase